MFPFISKVHRSTKNNKTIQNKRNTTATKNNRYKKEWANNKDNKCKKKIKVFLRQK